MTTRERDLILRVIDLLQRLVPDDEPRPGDPAPRRCPVSGFAKRYLLRHPASDVTSGELWQFYTKVAAAGEIEPLSKAEFLRRLPGVMEATFGVRKCHNVTRDGRNVRGFKCVGIREDACLPSTLVIEPE